MGLADTPVPLPLGEVSPKETERLFLRLLHIVQERLYLIDLVLRYGAARLVDPAQLGGVALHSADLQRDASGSEADAGSRNPGSVCAAD